MIRIKRTLTVLLSFIITLMLSIDASAQLVTYQFTGTKIQGTTGIGTMIVGSLTLDAGAAPDVGGPSQGGEQQRWVNGNFSIDGMTDSGVVAGTSLATSTQYLDIDEPLSPAVRQLRLLWAFREDAGADLSPQIYLQTVSFLAGDGFASADSWNPFAFEIRELFIEANGESGYFSLDTFTATINIDGCDTGIADFVYEGQTVSQHLDACAVGAKNHGSFVSCVAKLTNKLKKAELISGAERGVIMACAAKSTVGRY